MVAILLLTEITPKSIAVHNPTEVANFVVRPVAWLSVILYPVGRVVMYLSMGMLKILDLKGKSGPYVTEEELKLMLRGAELSGAIEEEEQFIWIFAVIFCSIALDQMLDIGLSPDLVLYNTLIHGFCGIGDMDKACNLVEMMIRDGILPNKGTHRAFVLGFGKKWVKNPEETAALKLQQLLLQYDIHVDVNDCIDMP
ncbi:hypothetical protein J1N35_028809 [Gossypium stocksii]|uniref:CNNM transmembrane domain-containing protein n=1 Tax=Gossypium stocksii TaxID=47602 RepID=A0A9D3UX10_9ROSI|nr:hypothetical protein J1N35_028809 [Gossypium stocksii]